MRHLFIDTNVIIDFLIDRTPFSRHAADIFELALKNKIKVSASSLCFNNVYYIIRKSIGHSHAIQQLNALVSFVHVQDVTQAVIKTAISSGWNDFEDAIQYYTALTDPSIDAIITRDKSGFSRAELPVLAPVDVIKLLRESL